MKNKGSRIQNWLIFIVILLGLIAVWCLFPIFFQWLIVTQFKIDPEQYGKTYGAVGDTYGSLNTLVSSLALAGVAYSAFLQVTSLNETREATERQLELAEENHKEQLKEAKRISNNTALADQFYALMTFKNEMLYQMKFKAKNTYNEAEVSKGWERDVSGMEALSLIANKFKTTVMSPEKYNNQKRIRESHLAKLMKELFEEEVSALISYFYVYGDLIRLINTADVEDGIKENFRSVLRNTMLQEEQITLFWFASVIDALNKLLDDSDLFNKFHYEIYEKFALTHHKASHFKSKKWKDFFEINTPT